MAIATHTFPPAEQLERRYQRSLAMIARVEPAMELETSDRRYGCRLLCEEHQTCGTIASVLTSHGDATAKRHMAEAARYAGRLLKEAGKAIKVTEVTVLHERRGPLSIIEREVPQTSEQALAIHYFYEALIVTLGFGDTSTLAEFAAFPDAGYRSPNVVAAESVYSAVRAFQAWLSGDAREALARIECVLEHNQLEGPRAEMHTLRAIIARDEHAYRIGLHAFLTFHKCRAEKKPIDHSHIVSWPALALARLAKAQGMPVTDDGYLPTRLLPDGPIRCFEGL